MMNNIQVYENDGVRVIHEYFSSINQMLKVLESRENNYVMRNEHSSERQGDSSWSGTSSWDEAVKLLTKGYTDVLDKLKLGISKSMKSLTDIEVPKSRIREEVWGTVPLIPNYLQGLPKTMCYRERSPRKIKTIDLVYCPCENCGHSTDEFLNAGIAILSAIRAIEKSNISVKLDCMFMDAVEDNEMAIGVVRIKNYQDRLDLQKLCFPLVNASMERRIGFKYLETCPDLKNSDFSGAYGSTATLKQLEKHLKLPKNSVLLNLITVRDTLKNDPKKVIEYINSHI